MRALRIAVPILAALGVALAGYVQYMERIANPRVARELLDDPQGERAARVMLLTLPSGRTIPVNYLREERVVYAGADGRWWRELVGGGHAVTVLVRGETLTGRARAIEDDPEYTDRVFAKLRPNAIEGFGTLVEIRLDPSAD